MAISIDRITDALLPEIQPDAYRALALVDAGLDEALGKTLVALQAIVGELGDRLSSNVALGSPCRPACE